MRAGVTLAFGLAVVCLSGCGDDEAVSSARAACGGFADRPVVALLAEPTIQPSGEQAICRLATHYADVVMAPGWASLPPRLLKISPEMGIWQRRMLLLACDGCGGGGLDLDDVRANHPQWIMRNAAGNEVHLAGDPGRVLLDFGDPEYQAAWQEMVAGQLAAGGWTGVVVEDARNDLPLSATPIDPRTGQEMTDTDRARYLAEALALVRGALKTDGFSLVAENEPPTVVDPAQIGSTDAVMAQGNQPGFADRRGTTWDELFDYYRVAVERHVGAWITDTGTDPARRVFGLASYLLVSGPLSSYGPPAGPDDVLYRVNLGQPLGDPTLRGGAWVRTFDNGTVAVAPGDVSASVDVPGRGTVSVPAGGAVIATSDGLLRSG
jgi:hypothetical protein